MTDAFPEGLELRDGLRGRSRMTGVAEMGVDASVLHPRHPDLVPYPESLHQRFRQGTAFAAGPA